MRSAALILFVAMAAGADEWRTYVGSAGSRWNTVGHHGHDQEPCAAADCDADDFRRANLDDSIGFRAGVERDVWRTGALHLVAGVDATLHHTEYNLSQRDFSLGAVTLLAGADIELRSFRVGARAGAGGYTTTGEPRGSLRSAEISMTVPLRGTAAVRVARRRFTLGGMAARPSRDLSLLIVATSSPESAPWELVGASGMARPGAGLGGDRKLRNTALNRMALLHPLGGSDFMLELSWTSTAHESKLSSVFRGYDGNYRSKTIEGYGIGVSRVIPMSVAFALRWNAGVELADWRDEHRLLTRDGEELVAGVEVGVAAGAALRARIAHRVAFETGLQKMYWHALDLSELRWTVAIALTR